MARSNSGDPEALHALIARDLDWVREFVHRRLGGTVRRLGDPGDVVQDVMVNVLSYGPKFVVADIGSFRSLLATIVLRRLETMARRAGTDKRDVARERARASDAILYLGGQSSVETVTLPGHNTMPNDERALLTLASELLPASDGEVVRLREGGPMEFDALAEALGLSEDAARMLYTRAVAKLTRVMTLLRSGNVSRALQEIDATPE
jgi:RNA polymerase sigma factor (sigma-70 family)